MSCDYRLPDAAQTIAELLTHLVDPLEEVTVERVYAPDWLDVDFWTDNADLASRFTGRRVYVSPRGRVATIADRGHDNRDYMVSVMVLERYDGAGEVPNEWLDDRVRWFEAKVIDVISDARQDSDLPGIPIMEEWPNAYSPALLRQAKLFYTEAVITYRRIAAI